MDDDRKDDKPRRAGAPKLIGTLVFLAIGLLALAYALGWRPVPETPPAAIEVDQQTLDQAQRDEDRMLKQVEEGKAMIGGP